MSGCVSPVFHCGVSPCSVRAQIKWVGLVGTGRHPYLHFNNITVAVLINAPKKKNNNYQPWVAHN